MCSIVIAHPAPSACRFGSQASAAAFDVPDHVAIVIHDYRWRLGLARGETHYDEPRRQLALAPVSKEHGPEMHARLTQSRRQP